MLFTFNTTLTINWWSEHTVTSMLWHWKPTPVSKINDEPTWPGVCLWHCVGSFFFKWRCDVSFSFSDKDYDNAIKYYTEALELNPSNAIYYSNRSLAYLRTECYGYALADATKALDIDKNYIKGYYRRATSNMALGKFKAALKDYETVRNTALTVNVQCSPTVAVDY